jgi:Protein kinase domain.
MRLQSNIVVNADGKAVLIDFGSSVLLKSGTAVVSPLHDDSPGSTRWMAPEALRPHLYALTQKADVWSFACLEIEVSPISRIDVMVARH